MTTINFRRIDRKEESFYNLLTGSCYGAAIDLKVCLLVDKSFSGRVDGAFRAGGKVGRYISVRRKVLEISVTKFKRANRPRASNNDGRTEIPLRDTRRVHVGSRTYGG